MTIVLKCVATTATKVAEAQLAMEQFNGDCVAAAPSYDGFTRYASRDLNSAHPGEGGHEFMHLLRPWGIAERYRRNCIDENENIRLFMSITVSDTPRQAFRYFTDYQSEDIYDWTD